MYYRKHENQNAFRVRTPRDASNERAVPRRTPPSGEGSKPSNAPVQGYTKKDGTYVEPYHRTTPDATQNNNYGTKGNVNPYTGKEGTKAEKK